MICFAEMFSLDPSFFLAWQHLPFIFERSTYMPPSRAGSDRPDQPPSPRTYTHTVDRDEQGRGRPGRHGPAFGLWAVTEIRLVSPNESFLSPDVVDALLG